MILLVFGLFVGQGSLFLSQSFLLSIGAFNFLATFALAFSVAVLALQLVDNGGAVLLARIAATGLSEAKTDHQLNAFFSHLLVARLLLFFVMAFALTTLNVEAMQSFHSFLMPALVAVFFWCFNVTGILDGRNLSGLSGISWAIPYLFSACTIPFTFELPIEAAMRLNGFAFGIGTTAAVLLQWAFLLRSGIFLSFHRPVLVQFLDVMGECFRYQMSFLPGQILYRGQLLIANWLLPVELSAMYAYGKQASNSGLQIVSFARRVSFPSLILKVPSIHRLSLRVVYVSQQASFILSAAIALTMGSMIMLTHDAFPSSFATVGLALSIMSPTVLSASIFAGCSQFLLATKQFLDLATITLIVTVIALLGAYIFGSTLSVWAFILAEVVAHVLGVPLVWRRYKSCKIE